MKHLKEMIIEAYGAYNSTKGKQFLKECEKEGLTCTGDADFTYIYNSREWFVCINTWNTEGWAFHEGTIYNMNNGKLTIGYENFDNGTTKEKNIRFDFGALELAKKRPADASEDEIFYEYSKENAKTLADALNTVK